MNDVGAALLDSLQKMKGKSADYITHALKEYGNGSMVDGLIKIVAQLDLDKKASVLNAKLIYGLGGIGVAFGSIGLYKGVKLLYTQARDWHENKLQNQELIQVFEKEADAACGKAESEISDISPTETQLGIGSTEEVVTDEEK